VERLAGRVRPLPSTRTILHEVGHSIEQDVSLPAEVTRFRADLEVSAKSKELEKALAIVNSSIKGIDPFQFSSKSKERAYQDALLAANDKVNAVVNQVQPGQSDSSSALDKTADSVKRGIKTASDAISARIEARSKLPVNSGVVQSDVEQAQAATLNALKKLEKQLIDNAEAQKQLEKGQAAKAASSAKIAVGKGKDKVDLDISERLAELVALVHLKGIDIAHDGILSDYVKGKWPTKPGELFADLYEMSVAEPEGLKAFDKDIAKFFENPIGPKKPWDEKVRKWINARRTK